MSHNSNIECRIYVASLADYNAGIHHGEWIDFDACDDLDAIQERIEAMLAASPYAKRYGDEAEEWAVHDYEGFHSLSENPDLENLWTAYEVIQELGEAYVEYTDHVGASYAAAEGFEDAYQGQYASMKDFAEHLIRRMRRPGQHARASAVLLRL